MTSVVKKDGSSEDFSREKIARSLTKCDASTSVIKEVVNRIPEKEGMSTNQIRELVMYELKIRDAGAASRYRDGQYIKEMALPEEDS